MYLWKLPDEQLIEQLRKRARRRKTTGLVFIIASIVTFYVMHWCVLPEIHAGIRLYDLSIANDTFLIPPADPQFLQRNLFVFSFGTWIGTLYFSLLSFCSMLLGTGLRYLFSKDRRSAMLLTLWDAKHRVPPSSKPHECPKNVVKRPV